MLVRSPQWRQNCRSRAPAFCAARLAGGGRPQRAICAGCTPPPSDFGNSRGGTAGGDRSPTMCGAFPGLERLARRRRRMTVSGAWGSLI